MPLANLCDFYNSYSLQISVLLAALGSILTVMWVLARRWRFHQHFWPKTLAAFVVFNYLCYSAETGLYRKCLIQFDGDGSPNSRVVVMLTLPVFCAVTLSALVILFLARSRANKRKPI